MSPYITWHGEAGKMIKLKVEDAIARWSEIVRQMMWLWSSAVDWQLGITPSLNLERRHKIEMKRMPNKSETI